MNPAENEHIAPTRGLAALTVGVASAPFLFIAFVVSIPILNGEPRLVAFLGIFVPGVLVVVTMTDFSHGFMGKKKVVHDRKPDDV